MMKRKVTRGPRQTSRLQVSLELGHGRDALDLAHRVPVGTPLIVGVDRIQLHLPSARRCGASCVCMGQAAARKGGCLALSGRGLTVL
jgi:hypothetical protein